MNPDKIWKYVLLFSCVIGGVWGGIMEGDPNGVFGGFITWCSWGVAISAICILIRAFQKSDAGPDLVSALSGAFIGGAVCGFLVVLGTWDDLLLWYYLNPGNLVVLRLRFFLNGAIPGGAAGIIFTALFPKSDGKHLLVLLAGLIVNICLGPAMLWAFLLLFKAEWSSISAICMAFLPIGMMLSGKSTDSGKTRFAMLSGVVLLGCGLVFAGLGAPAAWAAVAVGAMISLGGGSAYGAAIGAVVRWFPDRRGLVSGMTAGAMLCVTGIASPLVILRAFDVREMDAFKSFCAVVLVILCFAALHIRNPPADHAPSGWPPPDAEQQSKTSATGNLNWRQMLGQPLFWPHYAASIAGMAMTLIAPTAIRRAEIFGNGTEDFESFIFFGIVGIVLCGFLSDKFGRVFIMGTTFFLAAIAASAMAAFHGHGDAPGFLLPCFVATGLCCGAVLGILPGQCADLFGVGHFSVNFGILFSSFSIAALAAPQAMALFNNGEPDIYPKALLVVGCLALIGFVLTMLIAWKRRARRITDMAEEF